MCDKTIIKSSQTYNKLFFKNNYRLLSFQNSKIQLSKLNMSTIKKLINLYQKNKEIITNESETYFIAHIKDLKVHTDLFYQTKRSIKQYQDNIDFIHKKNKVKYVATHVSSLDWFKDKEKVSLCQGNIDQLIEFQGKLAGEIIEDLENLRIDMKMQLKFKKIDANFTLLFEQETMTKLEHAIRVKQIRMQKCKELEPENIWKYGKKQYKKLCSETMTKLGRMYEVKIYVRLHYAEYFNILY